MKSTRRPKGFGDSCKGALRLAIITVSGTSLPSPYDGVDGSGRAGAMC